MTVWLVIILFALIAFLVASRLRDRSRRRRAGAERQAEREGLQTATRELDRNVPFAPDGGPEYRDTV